MPIQLIPSLHLQPHLKLSSDPSQNTTPSSHQVYSWLQLSYIQTVLLFWKNLMVFFTKAKSYSMILFPSSIKLNTAMAIKILQATRLLNTTNPTNVIAVVSSQNKNSLPKPPHIVFHILTHKPNQVLKWVLIQYSTQVLSHDPNQISEPRFKPNSNPSSQPSFWPSPFQRSKPSSDLRSQPRF